MASVPRVRRRSLGLTVAAALTAIALTGCTGRGVAGSTPSRASSAERTVAVFRPAGADEVRTAPLEVADTPAEQERGLMGRTSLPDGQGMLFAFDAPTRTPFWMKDTLIPLSIAFVDAAGTVVDTFEMTPCEADPCEVYRPSESYTDALEMRKGWFSEHGIEPGTEVTFEDVSG